MEHTVVAKEVIYLPREILLLQIPTQLPASYRLNTLNSVKAVKHIVKAQKNVTQNMPPITKQQ